MSREAESIRELAEKLMEVIRERNGEDTWSDLAGQGPLIIALDGRCASGKSTFARYLAETEGFTVFHMDDYFLRPEQQTPERYAVPGGNVDRERFAEEVLVPLKNGKREIVYRPYDCQTKRLKEAVKVRVNDRVLVEGAYSCHPALWELYDLHVFMTVDPAEQKRRILARNGAEGLRRFEERWIPLEEAYFAAYGIEERCELVLTSAHGE